MRYLPKHFLDLNEAELGNARYLCNPAVFPDRHKLTLSIGIVTCVNCIKKLTKGVINGND